MVLSEVLHKRNCSLVVSRSPETVACYYQKGVRDLAHLYRHEPAMLRGASIADKVIGKAAAGYVVLSGVKEVYAEVMSRQALPILDEAHIPYTYGTLVDHIVLPTDSDRCPLEQIVAPALTASEIVSMLESHFCEMKHKKSL